MVNMWGVYMLKNHQVLYLRFGLGISLGKLCLYIKKKIGMRFL